MISRYQDIMSGVDEMIRKYEARTKQVQFRMNEKLFKAFKIALLTDDKSMTDMLNDAVKEYVKKQGVDLLNPPAK